TWLHTADYPGSHVVIRDSGKKTVPERTLVEAAQLAAFYSNAREHGRVSVRYTQRKFVHKPKKAPAGMVSLSSFKTVLVEPGVNVKLRE
ncbi:MAG TPA: NFACT RNA binding domain-containing protein, partial [Pyrinomonadaceae bacterium]|nr:NFACT RNA binding domain-containing protein [Pyrinomonadaceae bacterium]